MKYRLFILIYFNALLLLTSIACAEQFVPKVIIDAYKDSLEVYSINGDKLGKIVTKEQVKNKEATAEAPSGHFVKVVINEEDVWLRSRELKFAVPESAPCPESKVTKSSDRTEIAASGIGCDR